MKTKHLCLYVLLIAALVLQPGLAGLQPAAAKAIQSIEAVSLKPQADSQVKTAVKPAAAGKALPSNSSAGAYTISGRVTDPDGGGMEGVTIRVVQEKIFLPLLMRGINQNQASSLASQPGSPSVEPTAITDADGYYTIPNIPKGRYTVIAKLDGILFTPAKQAVVLPGAGVADFQVEIIDPKIPDTTEVLPDTTDQYLQSVSADGSVLTFSQSTPELQQLAPGDILVSDGATEAPNGLLRKVTSVSNQGGGVVVTTEPAGLEEAVEDGAIYEDAQLTPADVTSMVALPGVLMKSPASPESITFYFEVKDVVLYDKDKDPKTDKDQVKASGSIEFNLDFELYLKIQNWSLDQFTVANKTSIADTIEISSGAELSPEDPLEYPLAKHTFKSMTVWVGWVPVVIVPQLDVVVGIDGSVSVGISTSVTHTLSLRAGISYAAGRGWYTFSDISNEFDFEPPHPTFEISLEAFLALRFNLYLYGVAGPYVDATPFAELIIQPLDDPWWELWIGLKFPMGFRVEGEANKILKLDPVDLLEFGVKISLARSNSEDNAPDAAEIVSPLDGSLNQDINVDLQWTGSDPDEDELNYEVYFGDINPPPLVITRQSAETYDPGPLNLSTDYYWKVITWDEYGMSTAGPIWKFITPNNPPDEPSNPSPGMGAGDQSLYPVLSWQSGDQDPGDSVTYTIFMSTAYPPQTIVSSDQSALSYETSKLTANTTHYWKVVAKDNHGATTSSKVWNFTTGDPIIPGEMVLIPAGNFQMGCDSNHNGGYYCEVDAQPVHTVYLDYYRIDRYEVTNAEYEECVSSGACEAPHGSESNYGNPDYADYPVVEVSWFDANDYCTWAGKRLPTEAEWEKAARGSGDTRPFPWGDYGPDCRLANMAALPDYVPCFEDTRPVGSFPAGASPYGVMDMIGNVTEWVYDWYQWDYYSSYPVDSWPHNPTGPDTGGGKLHRGGPFWVANNLTYRFSEDPDWYRFEINDLGFRCAETVVESLGFRIEDLFGPAGWLSPASLTGLP